MFWFFIACFLLKHFWAQVKPFKKILPFQDDFSYEEEEKKIYLVPFQSTGL